MPKRTTPAAPAPEISLPVSKLIEMAQSAMAEEPADDYVGRSIRARLFLSRLVGALPDTEGNALANALGFEHLVADPMEAGA